MVDVAHAAVSRSDVLRLGIIGSSEGNGHPYSWSAIFNGYDPAAMAACPYPVIPEYLGRQQFPEAQLAGARVTHIWTPDAVQSTHIAAASRIDTIVRSPSDMLGEVDAVLLARDDADHHESLATPFLEAGLPIYIDKPIALDREQLDRLFALTSCDAQIFSCSALRYAKELMPTADELERIGSISHVFGVTPQSWNRYSAHVIDPMLQILTHTGDPRTSAIERGAMTAVSAAWPDGPSVTAVSTGKSSGDIALTIVGQRGTVLKTFRDSFSAFKRALEMFVEGVRNRTTDSSYDRLSRLVTLIEAGARAAGGPAAIVSR